MIQAALFSDPMAMHEGLMPLVLGALPKMQQGTVFVVLLALCAVVTVWGVYQLISVLSGGNERIGQGRQLNQAGRHRHVPRDTFECSLLRYAGRQRIDQ